MTRTPKGDNWIAVWSTRSICGYHAKGWCAKHRQCCKKQLKITRGDCWTAQEAIASEDQLRVAQLRTLQPSRVKNILTIGSA